MFINNILNNFKISLKMILIIIIGILNLIIISFISNYLMKTSHIVTILGMCERRYAIEVNNAQLYFEKYHRTNDEKDFNNFIESIEIVNRYTKFFGNLDKLVKTESNKKLVDDAYNIFHPVKTKRDAGVLINRVKLLLLIRLPLVFELIKLPSIANPLGEKIKKDIILYSKLKTENKQQAYVNIQSDFKKMLEYGETFSDLIVELVSFVKALSFFALFSVAVILTVLNLLISMYISKSINDPLKKIMNGIIQISNGDFSSSININRKDEIGILALNYNKMINALNKKIEIIKKIAEGAGDFTIKVEVLSSKDEFGKNLQKMLLNLNIILNQIKKIAEQVNISAVQVSSSSQSLSTGASEQAGSIEEITSSITEINTQAKNNADNALQANELAKQSSSVAEKGNIQMSELVDAMKQINNSSEEITKIVKIIDDISFQINLLALNANVEAARAGKYGKGFAVVAEEVRNLAGRTAEALTDTKKMVENSIKNISNGNQLVDKTAGYLNEIVTGTQKVVKLVEEITTASKQQSTGLNQISTGLNQIDLVTQSNAANAEESASASEILNSQSEKLNNIVSKFKLINTTETKKLTM